jgi:peptidoglycan/xylan/chitin deacetylase (PgdA/CDA1 family)
MRERLGQTLGRLARARQTQDRNQPIVLLYHRLGPVADDPQLLSVTAEHFAEHLRLIAEHYVPVRLGDLVPAAAQGRAPPRAVAITFDDGYADNLLAAKPLLERSGAPATVFVASGYVRGGQPFWWDELERLLLRPGRLPSVLTVDVGPETLVWELGDDAAYTSVRAAERTAWTVLDDCDPGLRQRIYRVLCARIRALDEMERERALESLRAVADPGEAETEMPRPLTPEEVARLAEGDLIDVGAHTLTHPALSRLPPERQRVEVAGSKRQLEEMLGRPVSSFAYPYGTAADFDETTVSLVRDAGFAQACASVAGRVTHQTDPLRIPRMVVRDWSGDELARRISTLAP